MIAAIVAAAGLSRRMGQFKLLLPAPHAGTVIGQVVATLEAAELARIIVVTGHRHDEVAAALANSRAQIVPNPDYAAGEMLSSIQAGLRALDDTVEAALLCLGDQPQMQTDTVAAVLAAAQAAGCRPIVVPSYQMRAGHPIVLPAWLWPAVLASDTDLRTVMRDHRDRTHYVNVDTPTILADLDTPDDYAQYVNFKDSSPKHCHGNDLR